MKTGTPQYEAYKRRMREKRAAMTPEERKALYKRKHLADISCPGFSREKERQRGREYALNHRAESAERTRRYVARHLELVRAKARAYAAPRPPVDPDVRARDKRLDMERHGPERRAQAREYQKLNRAEYAESTRRYRARRADATVEALDLEDIRRRVLELGGKCVYCGGDYSHIDHIMPIASGGAHALVNLAPACSACNFSKNASHPIEWVGMMGRRGKPVLPSAFPVIVAALAMENHFAA